MKYYVITHGITGDYKVDYGTEEKANAAAKNIQGLGWEAEVVIESEDQE